MSSLHDIRNHDVETITGPNRDRGRILQPQRWRVACLGPNRSQPIPINFPFTSAGRGLPGMQGGPPLNAPMGAQDPSRSYMQPSTVGPLFCDPALNIQC